MKSILPIFTLLLGLSVQAQLAIPREVGKRKSTDRTKNAIDQGIDKDLDKVEKGIGNLFKKKEKPEKDSESKQEKSGAKEEETMQGETEMVVSTLLPQSQTLRLTQI